MRRISFKRLPLHVLLSLLAGGLLGIGIAVWVWSGIPSGPDEAPESPAPVSSSPIASFYSVDDLLIPDLFRRITEFRLFPLRNAADAWTSDELEEWWMMVEGSEDYRARVRREIRTILEHIP